MAGTKILHDDVRSAFRIDQSWELGLAEVILVVPAKSAYRQLRFSVVDNSQYGVTGFDALTVG